MKRQLILVGIGVIGIGLLFFKGRTHVEKNNTVTAENRPAIFSFSISDYIDSVEKTLSSSQHSYLNQLQGRLDSIVSKDEKIRLNNQLAGFWKDSVKNFNSYIYYISSAAKLENSEKNLTFAAQLLLTDLRSEQNGSLLDWKTQQAIELFEKAIQRNPANDDLKIGLGSCYIFGKGRFGSAEETMKGVQQVLSVVRKDSGNMKAQLVLGIGGYVSRQYDKAIYRLKKVVLAEPANIEAIAFLADAYAAMGDSDEAIRYYEESKRLINNPQYSKEVNERIKELKQRK